MLRQLSRRVGRRGAFLTFLAILNICYGYSLLAAASPIDTYDLLLPWRVWGWIWIACGCIAATGIFVRRDRFHYAVAAANKTAWSLVWVRVSLLDHAPRGWVSVVIWLAFAMTVLVVAGWSEPPRAVVT